MSHTLSEFRHRGISASLAGGPAKKNEMYIHLVLVLFIGLTSCSEQGKTSVPPGDQVATRTPQPIPADPKPIPNDTFVPLFYDGQLCHWVRGMIQDKNGDLWIGTNHYGVIRYNGDKPEYFTADKGFGGNRIMGIGEDQDRNIWFATAGGITKYDPSVSSRGGAVSFTSYSKTNGLEAMVWSMTVGRDGTIWIGTEEGVVQFNGETFSTLPLPYPDIDNKTAIIAPGRISRILEDRHGNLWFGRDGYGISKYHPSAAAERGEQPYTHFTKENGLPDNNVADLMEDTVGNIWIGTMFGGISMYDGRTFANFTKDGFVSGDEAYGFYEDKDGNIWFAAENHGVYRYNPSAAKTSGKGSFTNFHEKEGLSTNGINTIFEDREGRFWFGGWKGLFRYDGKTFFAVTKDGPWGA